MQIALIYSISSAMVWIRLLHFRRFVFLGVDSERTTILIGTICCCLLSKAISSISTTGTVLPVYVGGGRPFSIVIDLESTAAHSYQTIAESSTAKYKGGYTRHRRIVPTIIIGIIWWLKIWSIIIWHPFGGRSITA